jgi:hypothetical protein
MALVQCSECGHNVSDKASACPNCGAPVQGPVARLPREAGGDATRVGGTSALGIAAVILGIGGVVMPYFATVFLVPAALYQVCEMAWDGPAVAPRRSVRSGQPCPRMAFMLTALFTGPTSPAAERDHWAPCGQVRRRALE